MSDERILYLNGEYIPDTQASISPYDTAVILGYTVTEMTRTFRLQPFRLEDHLGRLFRSLRYVRIRPPESREDFLAISHEVLARNRHLAGEGEDLGLVHFVTGGPHPYYAAIPAEAVRPTVCIHAFRLDLTPWARLIDTGIHVVTPSTRHVPPQCMDPKMKYRSRMHFCLADGEARLVDPQAIALLLDLDGNITETGGANFLAVCDGVVVSPTTRNILPGVSRQTVFELAAELGIPVVERDMQVHDVVNADEALLASTPFCLMPVTRINGVVIGQGTMGPVTRRLLDAWSTRVGLGIVEQIRRSAAPCPSPKGGSGPQDPAPARRT